MVTEILKPTAIYNPHNLTGEAGVICHPDSTLYSDIYRLVNEEVADDDASYVELTAFGKQVMFMFDSTIFLNNYSKIKTCRIIARSKVLSLNHNFYFGLYRYNETLTGNESVGESYVITPTTTDWNTYYCDINIEDILSATERPFSEMSFTISFGTQSTSSDDKSSISTCLTQLYLELIYEDSNTEQSTGVIYLKENGTWTSIPCIIYQKQNGTWVTTDSTIFNNGDKFSLQEVT